MKKPKQEPKIFLWDFIGSIAGNEVSRIIALVPIIGYLILFNDAFAEALEFRFIVGAESQRPPKFFLSGEQKLRLTFFGSIFVFIASLAYRYYRPPIMLYTNGDLDFADRIVESYSLNEIKSMERDVFQAEWELRTQYLLDDDVRGERLRTVPRLENWQSKGNFSKGDIAYLRALAREWWVGQLHTRKGARFFTLGSVSIGYIFLLLPTMDIVQAVLVDIVYLPR